MAIYKTVFKITVLSEEPFDEGGASDDNDPFDLSAINYAITEGDCVGQVTQDSCVLVPPSEVEAELLALGNDGSFFRGEEDEPEEAGS
jgi:hypothetical protein